MDASHVYVRAWALGCFHSLSTNLSEGADRVGGQLGGDKEYPFSGVNKSGRVWRKVSESDTRSEGGLVPLAGAAISIIFLATNACLSRQNTSFVVTKVCLVATKLCLSRQKFCRDKHTFVATKDVFCRKIMFVATNKTFVATKMIIVAAPANDRRFAP